jgi:acyl-CoA thioester hydrolase
MCKMAYSMKSDGRIIGREHHFPVQVYYEDTDFSGLVYHANYLRFMERARSDMLKWLGVDQRAAFDAGEGTYAVAELSIKYHAPARFDDALHVITTVERVRGASISIHQRVMRGDEMLTSADVIAAFLSIEGRPKRQPAVWRAAFEHWIRDTQ